MHFIGQLQVDRSLDGSHPGQRLVFALDESGGAGTGYDRFVIDLNQDKDLANDTLWQPLANIPQDAITKTDGMDRQICFTPLKLPSTLEHGQTYEMEVMPRFNEFASGHSAMYFIATEARAAEIRVSGQQINAKLINGAVLSSRWDHSLTMLQLEDQDTGRTLMRGYSFPCLACICRIENELWSFSTNPQGDRLYAELYAGDYGTLKLGAGGRFMVNAKMVGTLQSKDRLITIMNEKDEADPQFVKTCRLPVGDYTADMLGIKYGPLYIQISDNYHSDGLPRERTDPKVYGLKIRNGKSCVLDFSNKPEVLFASPPPKALYKPGDTIAVSAVLIDPELDIMFRNIKLKRLTSFPWRKAALLLSLPILVWLFFTQKRRFWYVPVLCGAGLCVLAVAAIGAKVIQKDQDPWSHYDTLTPTVTIQRPNGEVLASGTMPYG